MYASVLVDLVLAREDRTFDYRVPEGMRLTPGDRVRVPFGPRQVEGLVLSLTLDTQVDPARMKSVGRLLPDSLTEEQVRMAGWMAQAFFCTRVEALRLMIPAPLRRGAVREKLRRYVRALPGDAAVLTRSPGQRALYELLLAEGDWVEAARLGDRVPGASAKLRALIDKGLAQEESRGVNRMPYVSVEGGWETPPELTPDQQAALAPILGALDRGEGGFLLHGITGSGKTEVYFRAVDRVLAEGRTALILVPEIALTPQMVARFRRRFGLNAAVLHSRLSDGERYDEWRRIREGEARVVIGARSAVFAPLENLALVVVDEEHEASYQSETQVRYDAIAVARWRCCFNGAVLVLGSATPSVGRYREALAGAYTLIEMPRRAGGGALPPVRVVDMREELKAGNRSLFSRELHRDLQCCVARGQQAILLLNRRGYASFVSCRSCGEAVMCPHCDVSMTYHQSSRQLVCHYCGARQALPAQCPACGSPYIKQFGAGTQRVEEEVRALFPGTGVLRMDMDTTRGKEGHQRIIEAFERGEAQILVGTQMVAKGLDFPNVTLVGVLAADMTLFLPDYRGAERTFQLLTQVAGRAGRSDKPGRVVVQTYAPEHYAVQAAAGHDYRAFYRREIAAREGSGFPPFGTLVAAMISDPEEARARARIEALFDRLAQALRAVPEQRVLFQNRGPAVYRRIKDEHRYQAVFRLLGDREQCAPALERMARAARAFEDGKALIEINPAGML